MYVLSINIFSQAKQKKRGRKESNIFNRYDSRTIYSTNSTSSTDLGNVPFFGMSTKVGEVRVWVRVMVFGLVFNRLPSTTCPAADYRDGD